MVRLPNSWTGVYVQTTINSGDDVQRNIAIGPGSATARSFGHVILDASAFLTNLTGDNSQNVVLRWGVYYGTTTSNPLGSPAVEADNWLMLGVRQITTGWDEALADPNYVRSNVTDHWQGEIHTMRSLAFGRNVYLGLQVENWIGQGALTIRAMTRMLRFFNPGATAAELNQHDDFDT